jgi:NAD(P)-dependent dehydrogenase (short-subunit alcohol dehydrogenase family)
MLLDGRIALVTGGARGIGRETAITLARQGAAVVAADILLQELDDLASFARDQKHTIFCRPLDVTSPEQWSQLAHYVDREFHKLDILVNNAGMMRARHFFDTTIEDFQTTMRVNVESMFLGAKTMVPLLTKAGHANPAGASIINMCSVNGEIGGHSNVPYCASKGAVRMLTKALAVDLAHAKTNIRVNAVLPGAIETSMLEVGSQAHVDAGLLPNLEAVKDMVKQATPMGRVGRVDDIAGVVAFLASDAAKFMTGSDVTVDGGYSMV